LVEMQESLGAGKRGTALGGGEPSKSRLTQQLAWSAFTACWLVLLAYGLRAGYLYLTTPGVGAAAPQRFPDASRLPRSAGASLYMFVHPQCPCTRASLHELTSLMRDVETTVSALLVIAPTLDADQRWEDTSAAVIASRIPKLGIFMDREQREARRFGAATSGTVLLYDAHGALRFNGGITQSRGHVGENVGRTTLLQLLRRGSAPASSHAVFGCPLRDQQEAR
jgi:hypothetical protein